MEEIWKDIKDYEGLYQVSNLGNVYSLRKNKMLKPESDGIGKGYLSVNLGRNNHIKIHRLVAKTFIPNPNNYPEVNHIDGNTKNNRVDNLEWVTHKQNCIHYTYSLGQHKGQYKMKSVKMIGYGNKFLKEFRSISEAKEWLRENTIYKKAITNNISKVCLGKRNFAYGFKWKYKEE